MWFLTSGPIGCAACLGVLHSWVLVSSGRLWGRAETGGGWLALTVCSGPLGRSVAVVVVTPSPLCPQRLEMRCGFREESLPSIVHAWLLSGAQAAGRAECLEVWTCLLEFLLHRDLQEFVCVCLFLCSYGSLWGSALSTHIQLFWIVCVSGGFKVGFVCTIPGFWAASEHQDVSNRKWQKLPSVSDAYSQPLFQALQTGELYLGECFQASGPVPVLSVFPSSGQCWPAWGCFVTLASLLLFGGPWVFLVHWC